MLVHLSYNFRLYIQWNIFWSGPSDKLKKKKNERTSAHSVFYYLKKHGFESFYTFRVPLLGWDIQGPQVSALGIRGERHFSAYMCYAFLVLVSPATLTLVRQNRSDRHDIRWVHRFKRPNKRVYKFINNLTNLKRSINFKRLISKLKSWIIKKRWCFFIFW